MLHARIPESLDEEIRTRAESLGISVSNLVRNALQNAFGLVESVIADSASIASAARGEAQRAAAPTGAPARPGRILGWQEAILNLNAVCAACNDLLPKGTRAAIAVTDGSGPREIRCARCIEELTRDDGQTP